MEAQAPATADHHHRNGALHDQPVQIGTRDIEDLGGLLGSEQGGMESGVMVPGTEGVATIESDSSITP